MSDKTWRKAIEKALLDKGFTRQGAKKTAKMTIRKSKAKQARVDLGSKLYTVKTEMVDGQEIQIKVYPPLTR